MVKTAKLIPLLLIVSMVCVGVNQIAPQTVLLQHDNQFWLFDLTTRSQQLVLDPYLEPDAVFGHSYLSPDGKYLYFLVFHDQERNIPTQLRQFEITTGQTRTIFESA